MTVCSPRIFTLFVWTIALEFKYTKHHLFSLFCPLRLFYQFTFMVESGYYEKIFLMKKLFSTQSTSGVWIWECGQGRWCQLWGKMQSFGACVRRGLSLSGWGYVFLQSQELHWLTLSNCTTSTRADPYELFPIVHLLVGTTAVFFFFFFSCGCCSCIS